MTKKVIIILFIMVFSVDFCIFSQESAQLEKICSTLKKNQEAISDINIYSIDLDNDGDLDYILSFICGEPNCLKFFINKEGKLIESINEFGRIAFDFESSINYKASNIVIKLFFSHCCGESPFDSFRSLKFKNDSIIIVDNYVKYDFEDYCDEDPWKLELEPYSYLTKPYFVIVNIDNYNIRFSADINSHKADFTCQENTNIIGYLKKGCNVRVIGEYMGKDKDERTWLYVEISANDLINEKCDSPLTYNFEDQKLRGWISNKSTIKK